MEKDALEAAIGALESSIRTIDFWVLFFAVIVAASLTFEAVFSVAHFLKDRKLPPLRAELARIHAKESLKLEHVSTELNRGDSQESVDARV